MSYHLQIVNKVSSDLPLHISIKPNALSQVKVLLKRGDRGTILHFSGATNPTLLVGCGSEEI